MINIYELDYDSLSKFLHKSFKFSSNHPSGGKTTGWFIQKIYAYLSCIGLKPKTDLRIYNDFDCHKIFVLLKSSGLIESIGWHKSIPPPMYQVQAQNREYFKLTKDKRSIIEVLKDDLNIQDEELISIISHKINALLEHGLSVHHATEYILELAHIFKSHYSNHPVNSA